MQPVVFSGSSNAPLASAIADELSLPLGKLEIIRFADSECRVRILEDVEDKVVFIIQSLANPVDENVMEFLLLADAIKRGEAKKVIAVVPYHGYARQDRIHRKGECLSAYVIAKLIESVGFDKIITVEMHNESIIGFFRIPIFHLQGSMAFEHIASDIQGEMVVVTPDAGALKRAQKFAEVIGAPLALIEKKRDLDKPHTLLSMKVVGDIKGKTAIIIDDVIVTGGTLVNAAHLLKEKGAKQVIAAATHADFVGGADKILKDAPLDQVWVTDTIYIPPDKKFSKLKVVPSAPLIASEMKKMIR
jgi:ribose-phosphate pyrophosphokinase